MANKEITLIMPESLYAELEALAESKKKTLGELLLDAVALEKWFDETKAKGNRILVEQKGVTREITST